ncbi:hypothetical protein M427DRAFT_335925 [Gonapodya prolifera JEL478]|uniref:Protein kinase domain-containing protein n=1 Tax=Gonapodya prolifera (strain JEL478) TaxID=1344416 RepID=A0A139AE76_GONPJ|nr:hypothetical protein M427DRAFT_335925 [Gonapodya prolifera JEL478]|eukprot:KXS14894.1 hypothetical protein M427DRAFT_335925 [Gonapodya prolifera JEL478]
MLSFTEFYKWFTSNRDKNPPDGSAERMAEAEGFTSAFPGAWKTTFVVSTVARTSSSLEHVASAREEPDGSDRPNELFYGNGDGATTTSPFFTSVFQAPTASIDANVAVAIPLDGILSPVASGSVSTRAAKDIQCVSKTPVNPMTEAIAHPVDDLGASALPSTAPTPSHAAQSVSSSIRKELAKIPEAWEIKEVDLKVSQMDALGQGGYGAVYRGIWLDYIPVAVKFVMFNDGYDKKTKPLSGTT